MSIWSKFGVPPVDVETRADGSSIWRSREALAAYPTRVGDVIQARLREMPERPYIAQQIGRAHV